MLTLDFTGRVALVTGAAQGIGRAIATGFTAAGATVHVTDMDAEGLARTAEATGASAYVADLADRAAAHRLVDAVTGQSGGIDMLVSSAGGVRGQQGRPVEEITEADWRVLFAANVDSVMWLAQALAPQMKARGSGKIVTIASGAGLRPSLTGIQAYAAAKHALVGLTRQLALELGPFGINVNAVAPGFVLSNPATIRQWEGYGREKQAAMLAGTFMRRLGEPEDIANAALFLASDLASYVSGQVLSVDGGRA
jgi:3-oxoacyl-[acyl-carrier protein] reductase